MRVWICDRCGDVLLEDPVGCRCDTPYDPVAVRRRHREAVLRARRDLRTVTSGADGSRAA
jgi:hypothetical protein